MKIVDMIWTGHDLIINSNIFEHIKQKWKASCNLENDLARTPRLRTPIWSVRYRRTERHRRPKTTYNSSNCFASSTSMSPSPPSPSPSSSSSPAPPPSSSHHLLCTTRQTDSSAPPRHHPCLSRPHLWFCPLRQLDTEGASDSWGRKKRTGVFWKLALRQTEQKTKTGVFRNFGKLDLRQVASPHTVVNKVRGKRKLRNF